MSVTRSQEEKVSTSLCFPSSGSCTEGSPLSLTFFHHLGSQENVYCLDFCLNHTIPVTHKTGTKKGRKKRYQQQLPLTFLPLFWLQSLHHEFPSLLFQLTLICVWNKKANIIQQFRKMCHTYKQMTNLISPWFLRTSSWTHPFISIKDLLWPLFIYSYKSVLFHPHCCLGNSKQHSS